MAQGEISGSASSGIDTGRDKIASFLLKDFLFWLSLLLSGFVLSLTLWFGMGVDAGMLSYCSWVWEHYDLPPYVGCLSENFPGIFIIHRLTLKLFGESVLGFRVFDCLIQLSSLIMIFYLAKRISRSSLAGFLADIFYATYYYSLDYAFTAEREVYIFWLILIMIIVHLALASRVYLRAALVGALAGFCFLIKPTFGLLWPVFGCWYLVEGTRQRPRKVRLEAFIFGLSCLLPSLVVVLLYWKWGYLKEMGDTLALLDFKLYSELPILLMPDWYSPAFEISRSLLFVYQLQKVLGDYPVAFLGAAIFIVINLSNYRNTGERKLFPLILSIALVGLASVFIQRRINPYQRAPFQGLIIILAGCGFSWIVQKIKTTAFSLWPRVAEIALGSALVALSFASIPPRLGFFAINYCFRDLNSAYLFEYRAEQNTVNYLKSVLRPEDEVYYFGKISAIPFLIGKKLPVPFPMIYPLVWRAKDNSLGAVQRQWRQEYIDGFFKSRPRFFIFDTRHSVDFGDLPDLRVILKHDFDPVQRSLDQSYIPIKYFGPIIIYELKTGSEKSSKQ